MYISLFFNIYEDISYDLFIKSESFDIKFESNIKNLLKLLLIQNLYISSTISCFVYILFNLLTTHIVFDKQYLFFIIKLSILI